MQPQRVARSPGPVAAAGSIMPARESEIRAQLDRILASTAFGVPERLRHFLSYVVEQTLAGRADRIKAYAIAVEVFGRDANFDIQNDPVVRIEAGRLRRALERYYLLSGQADPLLIEIPKGGYVPRFVWRPDLAGPAAPIDAPPEGSAPPAPARRHWLADAPTSYRWLAGTTVALLAGTLAMLWAANPGRPPAPAPQGPALSVKPFAVLAGGPEAEVYAAGIGEELLAQLARFRELTVFSGEVQGRPPGSPAGESHVLEGSVRVSGGKLRVIGRVLDAESRVILWSQAYDADLRAGDLADIETDIAAKVAATVAQPYGIIFSTPAPTRSERRPADAQAYRCAARFYRYRIALDAAEHAGTRQCLEEVSARYPDYATGWAMLSYLYLDEDRFQLNRRPGGPTPIARAREAAQRAIRLDPRNVRALQALMTILFFTGEPVEALRIGREALALNPNDGELLGEFGSRLAQSGDWAGGGALLEQAIARNPGHSDYYRGMLALAAYMQGHNDRALEMIRRADLKRFSIYHFVAALIFARAGLEAEAAASRAEFLALRPRFFEGFDGELGRRNFSARDRAILTEGAVQAGFPVGAGPGENAAHTAPGNPPGSAPSASAPPRSLP